MVELLCFAIYGIMHSEICNQEEEMPMYELTQEDLNVAKAPVSNWIDKARLNTVQIQSQG